MKHEEKLWREAFRKEARIPASLEARLGASYAELRQSSRGKESIPMKRNGHRGLKTGLLIAAAVVVLAAAALAIGAHEGFFESAFGDGVEGREAYTVPKGEDYTESYPAVERVAVDAEAAEALLGGYVADSGESVTLCGYTFTVESYVLDESGIGVMTLDVDNPDGLGLRAAYDAYAGEYTPFYFYFTDPDGRMIDMRDCLDAGFTTDTHARYACYLTPFDDSSAGRDITLSLNAANGRFDEETERELGNGQRIPYYDEQRLVIPASAAVPAETWSGGGLSVELSPVGLRIEGGSCLDSRCGAITLRFADGSEYTARGEGVENITVGSQSSDGRTVWYAFNRLVETGSVVALEIDGVALAPEG